MLPEFLAGRAETSVSFFQGEIEVFPDFFFQIPVFSSAVLLAPLLCECC